MKNRYNKKMHEIKSTEDFIDERARDTACRYNLGIDEILPQYLEFEREVISKKEKLFCDIDSDSSLNIYENHIRKIASSMIVYYELTKRTKLELPDKKELMFLDVLNGIKSIFLMQGMIISRNKKIPIKLFEQTNKTLQKIIELIEKDRKIAFEKLLEK